MMTMARRAGRGRASPTPRDTPSSTDVPGRQNVSGSWPRRAIVVAAILVVVGGITLSLRSGDASSGAAFAIPEPMHHSGLGRKQSSETVPHHFRGFKPVAAGKRVKPTPSPSSHHNSHAQLTSRRTVAMSLTAPPTTEPLRDGKLRPVILIGCQKCGTSTMFVELIKSDHMVQLLYRTGELNGKELFHDWIEEHWDLPHHGAAELRASRLYLPVHSHVNMLHRKLPLVALEASPSMFDPFYTDFLLHAFPNETAGFQYVAMLCDPTKRAESAYWHMVTMEWGHELRANNISVSEKLYADAKELHACVRNTMGLPPTADDAVVLEQGKMMYSSTNVGNFLPAQVAMMHKDAADGFPPLPHIEWAAVRDDWIDHCPVPFAGNYVHGGMYAQHLRRVFFDLVMEPLGLPFPTWASDASKGVLSPETQARLMVLKNTDLFTSLRSTVNKVASFAGVPWLYAREDATHAATSENTHKHHEALHPRVKEELDKMFAHEMALVERMVQRGETWFL